MKLAAVLACRNQSSRLYAKPLQNLDVDNQVTILDYLIAQLRRYRDINEIVLAISEKKENEIYVEYAKRHRLPYILGDDDDVLARLIRGAEYVGADQVFRVTTESPYPYMDMFPQVYRKHCEEGFDFSCIAGVPDGANFELIIRDALQRSWNQGTKKHRSELCTLYIFEHKDAFRIIQHDAPKHLQRNDMRLTVDWPEDLIVMRYIYKELHLTPETPLSFNAVIQLLDAHPKVNKINNWIDSGMGKIWD